MDVGLIHTLVDLLKTGGPAVTAVLFFWLYLQERRYSQALNAKILEIAVHSAEHTAAHSAALASLREVIVALGRGGEK